MIQRPPALVATMKLSSTCPRGFRSVGNSEVPASSSRGTTPDGSSAPAGSPKAGPSSPSGNTPGRGVGWGADKRNPVAPAGAEGDLQGLGGPRRQRGALLRFAKQGGLLRQGFHYISLLDFDPRPLLASLRQWKGSYRT